LRTRDGWLTLDEVVAETLAGMRQAQIEQAKEKKGGASRKATNPASVPGVRGGNKPPRIRE
jgi:hypothetical protein